MLQTGAQILIRSLIDQGVDVLFGYPGGSVLFIYDALYEYHDQLRHIVTSHEQGAAHAADGYARSSGKTGVVLATSGPGATNLVTGIATAYQDSVPMVAITGNVPMDLIGRDSFQEVDITGITNPVVKHNYIVQDVTKLAEIVREAFVIANSGRKGPVLIDIPKNITSAKAEYTPLPRFVPRPTPAPLEAELKAAVAAIQEAQRPLLYVGGGVVFSDASEKLMAFAEKINAPVCTSMMGVSSIPSAYPRHLGMIGMHGTATANYASKECDLLIAVGARFSDRVAGNRHKFAPNATILHIDIDASEVSKNVRASMAVVGDCGTVLDELTRRLPEQKHTDWNHRLLHHKAHNAMPVSGAESDDILNPREIIAKLKSIVGEDAIIVTDVGQHQMFTAQYYPFTKPRTFISSCGLGTMGFGMGAAVGTKIANPDRPVVLITGDGSFHMNMAEMAVAVSNKLDILVLVINNGVLGMVHQWQNLFYEGRYSYTEINRATDFALLGKAFGAQSARLKKREDLIPTLTQAAQCGEPCIVDCIIDYRERVFPIIPPGGTEDDMIFNDD